MITKRTYHYNVVARFGYNHYQNWDIEVSFWVENSLDSIDEFVLLHTLCFANIQPIPDENWSSLIIHQYLNLENGPRALILYRFPYSTTMPKTIHSRSAVCWDDLMNPLKFSQPKIFTDMMSHLNFPKRQPAIILTIIYGEGNQVQDSGLLLKSLNTFFTYAQIVLFSW